MTPPACLALSAISVGQRTELIRLYAALEGREPESVAVLLSRYNPQSGMTTLEHVPIWGACILDDTSSCGAFSVLMSRCARWVSVVRHSDGSIGVARNEHQMIPLSEALRRASASEGAIT